MLELLLGAVAGFVSWFLLMLKHGVRPGTGLLICSAIVLVFLVGAGFDYGSNRRDFGSVARILVFYLGLVIGYATWCWRRRALERASVRAATDAEARFRELSARAASPQFELPVYGSAQVLLAVGALGIAACLFFVGNAEGSTLMLVGGTMVLAAVVFLLLQAIPTLGQPRLVVTTSGIRLPHTPVVSWQLVEGIWLQRIYHRERVMSHSLIFYVPALPSWIHSFPWFMRLFHRLRTRRARQRLSVWLLNSSEDPDMVYRLAQHLWKQSTGRSRPWFPDG